MKEKEMIVWHTQPDLPLDRVHSFFVCEAGSYIPNGWVEVGKAVVTLSDPATVVQAQVEVLRKAQQTIRARAEETCITINEQINNLLSLEWNGEAE